MSIITGGSQWHKREFSEQSTRSGHCSLYTFYCSCCSMLPESVIIWLVKLLIIDSFNIKLIFDRSWQRLVICVIFCQDWERWCLHAINAQFTNVEFNEALRSPLTIFYPYLCFETWAETNWLENVAWKRNVFGILQTQREFNPPIVTASRKHQ